MVGALEGRQLTPSAKALDKMLKGGLTRAVKASRFKGKKGESLTLLAPPGVKLDRVYLVGLGNAADLDALRLQNVGGQIYAALGAKGHALVSVAVDALDKCKLKPSEMAAELALGARLGSYRFDKYRTKEKRDKKPTLKTLKVRCEGSGRARAAFAAADKVAEGVFFTRDLVSEPANVIYPESLAAEARKLTRLGVKVEVLGVPEMKRLGMGGAARRRPGQRAGAAPRGHALERRQTRRQERQGRRPAGLRRQGRHLRHRRHFDQAGRRHGGHEVGHGRRRRRHRPHEGAGRAPGAG